MNKYPKHWIWLIVLMALFVGSLSPVYGFNQEHIEEYTSLEGIETQNAFVPGDAQIEETNAKVQRRIQNFLLLAFGLLCLALFTMYRSFKVRFAAKQKELQANQAIARKNDEINQQKIAQLEKNQKILALDAMLKGEEAERRIISEDIHEGLGGLLSSIRFNLNSIGNDLENGEKDKETFDMVNHLLDGAISEVRRISYYVMPGALMKLGLLPALEDFCQEVEQKFGIEMSFQSFGIQERLDPTIEHAAFRLIQNALNNIIKFADATEVLVQLTCSPEKLNIIVEDNGKGFDPEAYGPLKDTYSFKSIITRIHYVDGSINIDSSPGEGTTLTLDIPLPKT